MKKSINFFDKSIFFFQKSIENNEEESVDDEVFLKMNIAKKGIGSFSRP